MNPPRIERIHDNRGCHSYQSVFLLRDGAETMVIGTADLMLLMIEANALLEPADCVHVSQVRS